MIRIHIASAAAGFFLDLLLGDPVGFPHPVRIMGWVIHRLETWIRRVLPATESGEKAGGFLLAVFLPLSTLAISALLLLFAYKVHFLAGFLLESFLSYQALAVKSLKDESMKVCRALEQGDVETARKAVSMIVGRDTGSLSEEEIAKAAVETVAENTSDGVTAPFLFLLCFGAAGGLVYKSVNTMDSMVGYKNDRYLYFGRCAARLDDALNYIPARVSAVLMIIASFLLGYDYKNAVAIYRRDRRCHASPNSAQTEAVCAGALTIRLGGGAFYFGEYCGKPTIGDDLRPVESEDIRRSCRLLYVSSFVMAALSLLIFVFLSL